MSLVEHLEKLNAFKVVAETGTLREAAARLHLTQPSLTRLIQTLEETSDQQLFYRSRQGMELTETGKLLLSFTNSVLKDLSDLEERMKAPGNELSGLMKIGSYESLADYFWPDFMVSMTKAHPELKLAISTHVPLGHHKALELGHLDMIVDSEPRVLGDFTSWMLYEDRFNFYGKKKEFSAELTPESARNLTLIYCPAAFDEDNKSILQHLEERGYFFRDKMELDSFTSVASFCEKGLGIAVLPQRLAATYLTSKSLSLIAMKDFPAKGFGAHSICATVRAAAAHDKRILLIVKLLRGWFKK
jgi:DNA-binding transcriptional LysR family regulator